MPTLNMRLNSIIAVTALFGAISFASAADDSTAKYRITTKHPADHVAPALEADKTVISVRSPGGIGDATIERRDAKWPEKITLRLHLAGLEEFRVTAGAMKLNVSVASYAQTPRVRVWKDDQEAAPLGPKDPLWISVRMLDERGNPTDEIPLKNGKFELQLPPAFFEQQPKSIKLQWIDFYRR